MAENVILNDNQLKTLTDIVKMGKAEMSNFDKRCINALEKRGMVKTSENKKGIFVVPTARGKKYHDD
jgi:hypothetical protein